MTTVEKFTKTPIEGITADHAVAAMNRKLVACNEKHDIGMSGLGLALGIVGAPMFGAMAFKADGPSGNLAPILWAIAIFALVSGFSTAVYRKITIGRHNNTAAHCDAEFRQRAKIIYAALAYEKNTNGDIQVAPVLREAAIILRLQDEAGDFLSAPTDALDTAMRIAETMHRVRLLIDSAPASRRAEMVAELQETLDAAQAEADALTEYREQLTRLAPSIDAWQDKVALADGAEYAELMVLADRHRSTVNELRTSTTSAVVVRESLDNTLRIVG